MGFSNSSQIHAVVIIADPLHTVNVSSDSSLLLAEGALKHGYQVYWCDADQVFIKDCMVYCAKLRSVTFADAQKFEASEVLEGRFLADFKYAFVRKDPPFNEDYKNLCWMLASQTQCRVINSPQSLLAFHEKTLPWYLYDQGVLSKSNLLPTLVSKHYEDIEKFCEELKTSAEWKSRPLRFVVKPWLGYGGHGVHLAHSTAEVLHLVKSQSSRFGELCMVQPCLPIEEWGDRRIFLVNGKIQFTFVRFPADGEIKSNLASGGSARLLPLNSSELQLFSKVGHALVGMGIGLAGVDMIGPYINEINITSPTGLRAAERIEGKQHAESVFAELCSL